MWNPISPVEFDAHGNKELSYISSDNGFSPREKHNPKLNTLMHLFSQYAQGLPALCPPSPSLRPPPLQSHTPSLFTFAMRQFVLRRIEAEHSQQVPQETPHFLTHHYNRFSAVLRAEKPFLKACEDNHLELVRLFVECRYVLPLTMKDKEKGFVAACARGSQAVVHYLATKVNPSADGDAGLCMAAENGHLKTLRYLSTLGCSVHAANEYPLREACYHGHLAVVRALLYEYGADLHAVNDEAVRGAAFGGRTEVVEELLRAGARAHAEESEALRTAAMRGHTATCRALLASGCDIHAVDDLALRGACHYGHFEVVSLLLDHGASVHSCNDEPLRIAAKYGRIDVVALLCRRGAAVRALEDEALCEAAAKGRLEIVKILLAHGADPNAREGFPMKEACKVWGPYAVVQCLVDYGGNVAFLAEPDRRQLTLPDPKCCAVM